MDLRLPGRIRGSIAALREAELSVLPPSSPCTGPEPRADWPIVRPHERVRSFLTTYGRTIYSRPTAGRCSHRVPSLGQKATSQQLARTLESEH